MCFVCNIAYLHSHFSAEHLNLKANERHIVDQVTGISASLAL